jgi:deoxyhypusine synthase
MGKPTLSFDPFIDLEAYTSIAYKAQKLGIFTIGGGVPRNWAQQIGPYLDLIRIRLRDNMDPGEYRKPSNDMEDPYVTRFWYAVRICPEPVHFGGLSGCTYSEGVSWGKFVPKSKGGKFAEVLIDATVAWPIIIKAVLERMGK